MKALIVALFLGAAGSGWAQTGSAAGGSAGGSAAKAPDPAYMNTVYAMGADSLLTLEEVEGQMKSKSKAFGFGGSESGYFVDGGKSRVRLRSSDNLRFAIKMNMIAGDPSMMLKLYRFETAKDSRKAVLAGSGGAFGANQNKAGKNEVLYKVQQPGGNVYVMIPGAKLEPGEYGFINMTMAHGSGINVSYTFFAFGVDP
jgi:hypothetical protein